MKMNKSLAKPTRRKAMARVGLLVCLAGVVPSLYAFDGESTAAWARGEAWGQIEANLLRFFANEKGTFLGPVSVDATNFRMPQSDMLGPKFLRIFGGVPLPAQDLGNGYQMLGGEELHNVATKAFVVTALNSSEVVIAALLHHNCGIPSKDPTKSSCSPVPVLVVYYPARLEPQVALTRSVAQAVRNIIVVSNRTTPASSLFHIKRFGVQVKRLRS